MERLLALGGVAVNAGFVRSVVGKVGSAAVDVVVLAFVCAGEEGNGCFGFLDSLKKAGFLERSKVERLLW